MKGFLSQAVLMLAATIAMAGAAAAADDSFRCGSKLIVAGMTQAEVLSHCGEPSSRSEEVQDVRSGNRVVGKTTQHRWTYDSYRTTRVLVFDQDRLISIQ
jgi:hypothetical protein